MTTHCGEGWKQTTIVNSWRPLGARRIQLRKKQPAPALVEGHFLDQTASLERS